MKTAQAKVSIINYTPAAAELLIYTKSGRLAAGTTLEDVHYMGHAEKMDHIDYMMNTIKTSFEFVDYVFDITFVSRAFTHQLVRTRTASYQQEAMRVVDARDYSCLQSSDDPIYEEAIDEALRRYAELVDKGVPVQDARGVLPIAVHTRIMMKANLRTLSDMATLRLCKRAEGEYQQVFKQMVEAVVSIHPWTAPLLTVNCIRHGICAFPKYDKCPVQQHCLKPETVRHKITEVWKATTHVANPVAKNGKTM